MAQFLVFAVNVGNGNLNYHIRKIDNPKPHELSQAVRVFASYEDALTAKVALSAQNPQSFNKPTNARP